jgi:hypothetical protein
VLLLTTTGRRSGKPRTNAHVLPRWRRSRRDRLFGGSDLPPAWWLNLQRDARVSVLIGGDDLEGSGGAAAAGHDRLWPIVTTFPPRYAATWARRD